MYLLASALHLPLSPLKVPIIPPHLRLHCGTQPPLSTPLQTPAGNSTLPHHQIGHLQDWPELTDPPWAGGRSKKMGVGGGQKAQRGTPPLGELCYKMQAPGTRQSRTEPFRASITGITSTTSTRDRVCLLIWGGSARQPLLLRWGSVRISRPTACWCMTRCSSSIAGCSANWTWRRRRGGRPEREVSRRRSGRQKRVDSSEWLLVPLTLTHRPVISSRRKIISLLLPGYYYDLDESYDESDEEEVKAHLRRVTEQPPLKLDTSCEVHEHRHTLCKSLQFFVRVIFTCPNVSLQRKWNFCACVVWPHGPIAMRS